MAMLGAAIPICKIVRVNSGTGCASAGRRTKTENIIGGWIYYTMRNFIIPVLVLNKIA